MPRICSWFRTWDRRPSPPASGWLTWRWTTCSRGSRASRCRTRSLPEHLDDHSLRAPAVELAVEDLLPRPEVEAALGDRHDHLVVHQQVLQVGVAVVLAAAVVAVVAGVREQLPRNVVRRLLPAQRRDFVQPLERVLVEAALVVVDPDRRGDVHRTDEHEALGYAGLVDGVLYVVGDPNELAAALRVEGAVDRVRLHRS